MLDVTAWIPTANKFDKQKNKQIGDWNQASFIGFKLNKTPLADKNHTPANSTFAGMMKTKFIYFKLTWIIWSVLTVSQSLDSNRTGPCKLLYLYHVNTSWVDCVQRVQYEYLHLYHSLKKCLHWTKEVNTSGNGSLHQSSASLLWCPQKNVSD